jgi:uncharacterized membrane protein
MGINSIFVFVRVILVFIGAVLVFIGAVLVFIRAVLIFIRAAMNTKTKAELPKAKAELQGICASGWRIPTDADWKKLEGYFHMSQAQQNKNKAKPTDISLW